MAKSQNSLMKNVVLKLLRPDWYYSFSDAVIYFFIYTEQKYKRNTFVFAPIFHELNSKI